MSAKRQITDADLDRGVDGTITTARQPAPAADDLRAENERLRGVLATIVVRCDAAKQQCREGARVSAFNLASGILGQIGSDAVALRHPQGGAE